MCCGLSAVEVLTPSAVGSAFFATNLHCTQNAEKMLAILPGALSNVPILVQAPRLGWAVKTGLRKKSNAGFWQGRGSEARVFQ